MTALLPSINALLNATAAVLLTWGYTLIRRKRIDTHRRVMFSAFVVSCLFLVCYLIYHYQVGHVVYQKTGIVRAVYLSLLTSHTVLAAAVPFLAVITLRRGLRNDLRRHVALAHWTFPIWLYVSVTGVVVYWMLYWL